MDINLDTLDNDNTKYVELYDKIVETPNIESKVYLDIYSKVYQLVNQSVNIDHKYKQKLYEKLNVTYNVILKCIKNSVDEIYKILILEAFKNTDYNITFIKLYNNQYQIIFKKIKNLDDIFKYFHTNLSQTISYKNGILQENKNTPHKFKKILNDVWYNNIFQEFKNMLNKNIIIYFNTLRKSKQLHNSSLDISTDILNLFSNIKKLDDDNAIFDLYISKYYIHSSKNYYEYNYKLELDLIEESEIFLQTIDNILIFEDTLSNIFTKYTQNETKFNLIEMLISPKTSKLCKFMFNYIKSIVMLISNNEKKFYKDITIQENIFSNAKRVKNIINYIISIDNIFEDSKYIIEKLGKIIDKHLIFISDCLLENDIFSKDAFDIKDLVVYYQFLKKLDNIFERNGFKNSTNTIIKNIVENDKYKNNIISNLVKYLDSYFTGGFEHCIDDIYNICLHLKEKDVFVIQYKRNLSKRIIKDKIIHSNIEVEFINKLSSTDLFLDISHLKKIISDYYTSLENTKEYNNIYKSIDSYIINPTFGIWQLQTYQPKETYYCQDFKSKYQTFKTNFSEFYNCKYENRTLKFYDNYNTCVLEFHNNNQTYTLNCHLDIADFLSQFNECNTVDKKPTDDKQLINYLLKSRIILNKDTHYQFNDKCKFKKKELNLNHTQKKLLPNEKKSKSKSQTKNDSMVYKKTDYIDACIVRHLKSVKETNNQDLYQHISQKLSNKFIVEQETFDKCIKSLNEKEYLTLEGEVIKYIP